MYDPDEELELGIILIGKAIDFLPYFAYACIQMEETGLDRARGRFILKQIERLDAKGKRSPVYLNADQTLRNNILPITEGVIRVLVSVFL